MYQIVLLVEDDSLVRRCITAALEQENFIVLPASSGAEALEISLKRLKIDLVLADIQLGGDINGIELAQRLRQDKPEIKVLVMSGFPDREVEAAVKSLPFLRRPFSLAELTSASRTRAATNFRAIAANLTIFVLHRSRRPEQRHHQVPVATLVSSGPPDQPWSQTPKTPPNMSGPTAYSPSCRLRCKTFFRSVHMMTDKLDALMP